MVNNETIIPNNFIRNIIDADLINNKHNGKVTTRFPPEPNGYLHIGHAKSICLNFGIAADYPGGTCHLRFDDTNPTKEEQTYIEAIQDDVQWLGFQWQGAVRFSSDYFPQLYDYAVELINKELAYVCSLTGEQIREMRGTLTAPGQNSPYRHRSVTESLDLFARMRAGEFADGEQVLRAKIDMASPNMNLRDPVLYRILHASHHQTGKTWCLYPMYDYTHCISDALEGITHSLCTLEFEDHRPLYDWILDNINVDCHPQQIEFSRLALEYTMTSKRKLNQLVQQELVSGWDDPRMPTLAGLRRRGYTARSIRDFCQRIGVTKVDNTIEMGVLEHCIRDDLDTHAPRAMAVLNPLRVVIENYRQDNVEHLTAPCHPKDQAMGTRILPFTQTLYIDQADFRETASNKYKRLVTGGEVRLRNAYVIKCEQVIKDPQTGAIVELRCTYDDKTLGANPEGRKVKGVIHWVSAEHAIAAEVRLYDRLFTTANPGDDFIDLLNADSLVVLRQCRVEPSLLQATIDQAYQFEREGYFCLDTSASKDQLIFNRVVTLRDSWAKIEKKTSQQ